MECPHCKLINHDTTLKCDCGYNFQSHRLEATEVKISTKGYGPVYLISLLGVPFNFIAGILLSFTFDHPSTLHLTRVFGYLFGFGILLIFICGIVSYILKRKGQEKSSLYVAILPAIWPILLVLIRFVI